MPKECCKNTWNNKIKDEEPVFILRGNDRLAPAVIRFWFDQAVSAGVNPDKLAAVAEHLNDMVDYQQKYPERVKIPD